MRQTAGSRTALTPTAQASAPAGTRRSAATSGGRTGTVSRPSLANVPGRQKGPAAGGTGAHRPVGKGWKDYNQKRAERSQRYPTLDIDKEAVLIRFAEPEPFAVIYRHWVNKRPFTCIQDAEAMVECPLCDAGDKPKPVVFYNVITVSDAVLRVWEMSTEPTRKVQKIYDRLADKDETLDEAKHYYVVSKARKDNNFFEYDVTLVKDRDLQEDYGQDPLGDDEIAEAMANHGKGPFTDEVVYVHSKADLREAAEAIED